MATDLKHYVLHQKKYLQDDFCDKVLKEVKQIEFKKHYYYNDITGTYSTSGDQEFSISWENCPSRLELTNKLHDAIQNYINFIDMPWFSAWNGYTPIRFHEYKENKKMATHCDHIHSMFDGQRKGIPILSVLGLLNDDYEGGEFIIFKNHEIKLKKGDLIIFPSNFLYPHKVEPVKKGTRYSYISWVW